MLLFVHQLQYICGAERVRGSHFLLFTLDTLCALTNGELPVTIQYGDIYLLNIFALNMFFII